jgi:tetratricopeptide (TPR) repeat protein
MNRLERTTRIQIARQYMKRAYEISDRVAAGDESVARESFNTEQWQQLAATRMWCWERSNIDPEAARLCCDILDACREIMPMFLSLDETEQWLEQSISAARVHYREALPYDLNSLAWIKFHYRGMYQEAYEFLNEAESENTEKASILAGAILGNKAWIELEIGQTAQAKAHFKQWIVIAHKNPADERNESEAWNGLGTCHKYSGESADALVCYQKAAAIRPSVTNRINIAGMYHDLCRYDDAIKLYEELLRESYNSDDWASLGLIKEQLASVLVEIGQVERALALFDEALEIESGQECVGGQGASLLNKANILIRVGEYKQAESLLNEILTMPDPRTKISAILNLSELKKRYGVYPEAKRHLARALEWTIAADDKRTKSHILLRLSELEIETRQYAEVESYGKQAIQIAEAIPDPQTVSSAYNNIALGFYHGGRLVEAGEAAKKALTVAERSGYLRGKGKAFATLGLLAEEQSHFADALNLFEQSLDFAQSTRSEGDIPIVLHHIARMEDKLGRYHEALDHAQRSFMLLTKLRDPYASDVQESIVELTGKTLKPRSA